MDSLVSVIVPVYNVEKYLDRCIKNIVSQTYHNLQIILVDDGSPDNCPQICDEWANKDSRIKVIHKENGGLSDARNAGIELATGEYISFIDSDDYVDLRFIELLLQTMLQENSDIVECKVEKFFENGSFETASDDLAIKEFSTEEALLALIEDNELHQHVWNKLYKASIVKDVLYPVGKYHEDEFWTYQVFGRAQKVTKINKSLYYYFQRNDSIMGQGYSIKRLDALEGKHNRQKFIQDYFPKIFLSSKANMYGSCMYAYQCVLKYMTGNEKKKAQAIIKNYLSDCKLSMHEIASLKRSNRKWLYLSELSFDLCCRLRTMLGIGF